MAFHTDFSVPLESYWLVFIPWRYAEVEMLT